MDSMDLERPVNNEDKLDHDKEIAAIRELPELLDASNQENDTHKPLTINDRQKCLDFDLSQSNLDHEEESLESSCKIDNGFSSDNFRFHSSEKEYPGNTSILDSEVKTSSGVDNLQQSSGAIIENAMASCLLHHSSCELDEMKVSPVHVENSPCKMMTCDPKVFSDWTPDSQNAKPIDSVYDPTEALSLSASSSSTSSPAYKSSSSSSPHRNDCIINDAFPFIQSIENEISMSDPEASKDDPELVRDVSDYQIKCNESTLEIDDVSLVTVNLSNLNTTENIHNCLVHPEVLGLKAKLEESDNLKTEYLNKILSLESKVEALESLQDKVILLEQTIALRDSDLEKSRQEHNADLKLLSSFKKESELKFDALKKKFDQANKEKESIVMRYAKSEKEVMDLKKEKEVINKKLKDSQKELESLMAKFKIITSDKSKFAQTLDNKNMELTTANKEIERLKEEINSREIKIKWVQNKVKTEMDLHKECPGKIEKLTERITELEKDLLNYQEEIENCKKNLQDYETNKILENQLKEEQAKLILERHDQTERETKLKTLQAKNTSLIEENNNLSFQVQNLELERFELEKKLSASRCEAEESSSSVADLKARLVEFDSISNQLSQEKEKVEKVLIEIERLRKSNEELMQDMALCRSREAEMLSFTQKLTTKNVQLQSEFSAVEAKTAKLSKEQEKGEEILSSLQKDLENARTDLDSERRKRDEERRLLARQIAEKTAKCEELEIQLSEAKSQASGLKNKHQSALRELQREVQICHKKLEQYEEESRSKKIIKPSTSSPTRSSTSSLNSNPDNPLQVDVAPINLVDKILKLQSDVTKLQEKIEFLEDHNASLLEQLQKKGRLLHSYILREQAGALTNQASDFHKAEMSRHGGIMASVYGSKSSDEGMTLELSLEINHKLQAILEDTLLKNITLKENIDTLGDEIDRLRKTKS